MLCSQTMSTVPGQDCQQNETFSVASNVSEPLAALPSEESIVNGAADNIAGLTGDEVLRRLSTPGPYSVFTRRQKAFIVAVVSIAAMFSGLSGNIYFPAIPNIADDLKVSNEAVTLTVTAYMVFQGLSPTIWGAFADAKGRRVAYICTFLVYVGACIGLAETRKLYQLVILRCLQSTGSASTIAIGAGVLGDITTREERGGYMGIYQAGLLAPVAIGPILGGIFADYLGWRAIFWFLAIFAIIFLVFLILFLPETLRALVDNGSRTPVGIAKSPLAYVQRRRLQQAADAGIDGTEHSPTNTPLKKIDINIFSSLLILTEKEVTFIIIFLSIYYTGWQMIIASMSSLFKDVYHLTELQLGLTFISNGIGCILGTLLTGKFLDCDYRRIKSRYANKPQPLFPLERARLRTIWLYSFITCASTLVFGWTTSKALHISIPIISVFFLGWAATSIQSVITTLLVDIFPKKGASATAALNLARCLLGAGGTAAVLPLTSVIGVGWCFTLVAGVMGVSLGFCWVQVKFGPTWRREREEREKEMGS